MIAIFAVDKPSIPRISMQPKLKKVIKAINFFREAKKLCKTLLPAIIPPRELDTYNLSLIHILKEQEYNVEIDDTVKELIAKKGIDTNYGARPLKRAIQSNVEDRIAEAILDGKIIPHKKAKIVAENDEVKVLAK